MRAGLPSPGSAGGLWPQQADLASQPRCSVAGVPRNRAEPPGMRRQPAAEPAQLGRKSCQPDPAGGAGVVLVAESRSPGGDSGVGTAPAPSEDGLSPRGSCVWGLQPGPACQGARSGQYGMSCRCLLRQNQVLLTALEELQSHCAGLKKENNLLRRSCFPETQEKVRQLKKKNAELAIIAKRLEERARKLQEANLKVLNAPVSVRGSCAGLCRKALIRQRARDLQEQASALLVKDKQITALQRECQELQVKIMVGKDGPPCLPLPDFHHLLCESQKEVLRLQRQIALKNLKAFLGSCGRKSGDTPLGSASASASAKSFSCNGFPPSTLGEGLSSLGEAASKTRAGACVYNGDVSLPLQKVKTLTPEIKQQLQQLEFELQKKRKLCENLEHEVRKKHKRCVELEIQLQEVQSDNVRLSEENILLRRQVEWTEKVESENADLKQQVAVVTKERDAALQQTQELQNRLESLGQALKHMRDVAERRQQLELEHEKALLTLRKKQNEARQLQQDHVRELEDQCRSHTEEFNFLSQEFNRFCLQTGKVGLPSSSSSSSSSSLFMASEVACQTPPQLLNGHIEKGPTIVPASPQCSRKVQEEKAEGFSPPPPASRLASPDTNSSGTRSPDSNTLPVTSNKAIKNLESQSSSSCSDSMHNSPKSCPTPEVDTASEMEELDIDSVSLVPDPENKDLMKLRVFLARYSYDPFSGPNENPEAELPLTAGEYIYVYGEMDDDGFYEGELMDGRRGLVPSNFVERVLDDDLVTSMPQELSDLSQSSLLEKSFRSTSISSGASIGHSMGRVGVSSAPSKFEGSQEEHANSPAVPYPPRKGTVLQQFGGSILLGWEPPILPASCSAIQSYNIYVDADLRQTVKAGSPTKAVLEKLDLKAKVYRISVQSVSEEGRSDRLQCTFLVGYDFPLAPAQLKAWSVTATSAEISWLPSSSSYLHTIYLNGKECDIAKAGVYWHSFHNLEPSTSYVAAVEIQLPQMLWESSHQALLSGQLTDRPLSAEIRFMTLAAGSPDAPLDVRVENGPLAGILIISWLPVTIDSEGSSNGVRVTGYAIYADKQKVMEVTSPTAGSVLVDISQLQILQVCREMSVRTVSLYGESVDSVPAQIPLTLPEDAGCSSASQPTYGTSQLLGGKAWPSLAMQPSQVHSTERLSTTDVSLAKFPSQSSTGGEDSLLAEMSPKGHSSPAWASLTQDLPQDKENSLVPSLGVVATEELTRSRKDPEDDNRAILTARKSESPGSSADSLQTCKVHSVEQGLKDPVPERGAESHQNGLKLKMPASIRCSMQGEQSLVDSDQNEKRAPESVAGSSGRKLLKDISRDDSALGVSRTRREQGEKRSEPGNNRPLNLLADHSRGSDLSDIMEEEEEGEEEEENQHLSKQGVPKWSLREYCCRGNGDKLDLGDMDSDEEILDWIMEIPSQKNCSKALFSIPEVTEEEEEEEEEEDWGPAPNRNALSSLEKKAVGGFLDTPLYNARTESPGKTQLGWLRTRDQALPELIMQERGTHQLFRGNECNASAHPELQDNWEWDETKIKPVERPSRWRRPSCCKDRAHDHPQVTRKRKANVRECSRLSPDDSFRTRGGLYRTQSLQENLDVITSIGDEAGSDLCTWARQSTYQSSPSRTILSGAKEETCRGLSCTLKPQSLEADVEYDSEDNQDLTVTSSPASLLSSDGRADGSPTDCEDEWSDCSNVSESILSSGPREPKQCSSWEDEGMEWSGSLSRSPGHRCWEKVALGVPEERNPSLGQAVSELPWKPEVAVRSPALVANKGSPKSLDSPSSRRGRRLQRNSQAATLPCTNPADTWRGRAAEPVADEDSSVRLFVALFDYNPVSMSPNPDAAEEELPFHKGQILKVYGHKDADGFYKGEGSGRTGYVPCNMVSEVQVDGDGARKLLLQEGHIPADMLVESLEHVAFSPPSQRPKVRPPKPRRSKKAHGGQERSSEDETLQTVVAIFDCNHQESSSTLDLQAGLKVCAGDTLTMLGSLDDDDGFCYGEVNGQKGFLEAMIPSDGVLPNLGRQWPS